MHNNILYKVLLGILAILICLAGGITLFLYQLKEAPLSEQDKNAGLGLVAVEERSASSSSLSFYRLNDGKEQKFPGDFKYVFTNPAQALIFGFPSNVTSSQSETSRSQYFIILESQKAAIKEISGLPGMITSAELSANGAYILLRGDVSSTPGLPYSCVVLTRNVKYDNCDRIDEKIPQHAQFTTSWYGSQANTLLINSFAQNGKWFLYDVKKKILTDITASSTEMLRETNASGTTETAYSVRNIGPFAWLTIDNKTQGMLLPFGTKITPLTPNLAIAETSDSLWMINIPKRTKSILTKLPPRNQRRVEFFQRMKSEN